MSKEVRKEMLTEREKGTERDTRETKETPPHHNSLLPCGAVYQVLDP
jgi:hypothetical protein